MAFCHSLSNNQRQPVAWRCLRKMGHTGSVIWTAGNRCQGCNVSHRPMEQWCSGQKNKIYSCNQNTTRQSWVSFLCSAQVVRGNDFKETQVNNKEIIYKTLLSLMRWQRTFVMYGITKLKTFVPIITLQHSPRTESSKKLSSSLNSQF